MLRGNFGLSYQERWGFFTFFDEIFFSSHNVRLRKYPSYMDTYFMKSVKNVALAFSAALLGQAALVQETHARVALDRPNVIIMFLDDSGHGDFSHNGNPVIETPTLSKLAYEGTNFTQFYVTSPACSASRYSLLTGRYPMRSGLGGWVIGPSSAKFIHPKETTLAELLKTRGYKTGMFGKWHLGNPNKANKLNPQTFPPAHGFDEWTGTNVSHDYGNAKLITYDKKGNDPIDGYTTLAKDLPKDIKASESLVGLYTEKAVDFIRRHKDGPFFAYVAHTQPHLGVFASDKFKGKSRRGILGDAMAEIDDSMKQIVAELEKHDIAKNTLVIFTSDNGPWVVFRNKAKTKYAEARMHVGYATPFRDGKGSNWEGGHRVPGIFWWPGTIKPNRSLKPVSTLDMLPTLSKLTGAKMDPSVELDGRDISSYLLQGKEAKALPFSIGLSGPRNEFNAFRSDQWKIHVRLISQMGTKHGFEASKEKPILFDVEQDISERIDRAAEQTDVLNSMKEKLNALEQKVKSSGTHWDQ